MCHEDCCFVFAAVTRDVLNTIIDSIGSRRREGSGLLWRFAAATAAAAVAVAVVAAAAAAAAAAVAAAAAAAGVAVVAGGALVSIPWMREQVID